MKRVLVTGGTGFVGAYLLHYLVQKGYEVCALKRASSPMYLVQEIVDKIEWIEGDLLDLNILEQALKGVDHVYHSAAMVSFGAKGVERMMKVNVEGTANLVNLSIEAGVEKFLQVSSIAALGRKEHQRHVDEQCQWENSKMNTNYAISKFKAECEVWRGIEEGLNAVIVNPSMILGAGYWDVGSGKLFQQVDTGLKYYPVGHTGYVDVRDVAKASIALMESDINGERYILSAENNSWEWFFNRVAELLKKKKPSTKVTPFLGGFAWRMEWLKSKLTGKNPLITQETIRTSAGVYDYDNSKIKEHLGYEFRALDETIQTTAKCYLESQKTQQHYSLLPID
ncbi:MAG: NAD-dependent epimerase/dehydratase family protein [Aureispira sp.]|nr:NAD-dependent epimerase/dehydratase family protein [Aureispira sp.]